MKTEREKFLDQWKEDVKFEYNVSYEKNVKGYTESEFLNKTPLGQNLLQKKAKGLEVMKKTRQKGVRE